jgi:UDP-N-acetylglucosamine/UDP-N-acetylgalactosamine diphosphorylase
MAPAVSYDGKVLLEEKDRIAISPNGNGGWYRSLKLAGLVDHIKANGITHISAFSVDNVLQQINDPAFVGASLISNVDCCAKVIRKADPEEKVGVLCLEDGHPSIVEYYEITDDMRNLRDEEGELIYTFGVILNYMFTISFLERTAENGLSFHLVNKKVPYIDENGNKIAPTEPNAIKFEQLILDMVHLTDTCLPYEIIREKEFAPVKNPTGVDSVESARELLVKNGVEI